MKRYLLMMLILGTVTSPAFAATAVYLKDGGIIKAKSAWRSKGRVYVLVNRDTLTDFSPAEIDLKRTFIRKRRIAKKPALAANIPGTATTAPSGTGADLKKAEPENLVPAGGAGGTIRQHKKEMAERAGE